MDATLKMPFSDAQVEVLQLLASDLDSYELKELRKTLVAFRFRLVEERAERLAQREGWDENTINQISQEHLRTPYRAKQKALAQNKQNGKH